MSSVGLQVLAVSQLLTVEIEDFAVNFADGNGPSALEALRNGRASCCLLVERLAQWINRSKCKQACANVVLTVAGKAGLSDSTALWTNKILLRSPTNMAWEGMKTLRASAPIRTACSPGLQRVLPASSLSSNVA